jgi:hypothetical protein
MAGTLHGHLKGLRNGVRTTICVVQSTYQLITRNPSITGRGMPAGYSGTRASGCVGCLRFRFHPFRKSSRDASRRPEAHTGSTPTPTITFSVIMLVVVIMACQQQADADEACGAGAFWGEWGFLQVPTPVTRTLQLQTAASSGESLLRQLGPRASPNCSSGLGHALIGWHGDEQHAGVS